MQSSTCATAVLADPMNSPLRNHQHDDKEKKATLQ